MRFNPKILILVTLIFNIILFSIFVYLYKLTNDNFVLGLGNSDESASLPVFNKSIEDLRTFSKAFIIYDPEERLIIAGKNEKLRFTPASTVKIMTAVIVLEEYSQDRILYARNLDVVQGSKMKLYEGEGMTVENLLYGLMLPSGNDAAHVLSENYRGASVGFVTRMNERAKELNLVNTRFYDPAGYLDENYTTAYDLARLASYAIKMREFAKIVSTKNKQVFDISGTVLHELSNLNELLGQNGVNGIKTGFTEEAQGVLVTSIVMDGKTYIVVVLNSPDRFQDTSNLINNAIKNLKIVSY